MALPFLMPDPERGNPRGAFDCAACMETVGPKTRATMHCGWMPREDWAPGPIEGVPPKFGPDTFDVDICPGWLVRQAEVIEGAEAYEARRDGVLDLYDPHGLNIVWELAAIAQRSFHIYQDERQKLIAARMKSRP